MKITDQQNRYCLTIILEEAFGYKADYAYKLAVWSDTLDDAGMITPKKADLDALKTAQTIVNRIEAEFPEISLSDLDAELAEFP